MNKYNAWRSAVFLKSFRAASFSAEKALKSFTSCPKMTVCCIRDQNERILVKAHLTIHQRQRDSGGDGSQAADDVRQDVPFRGVGKDAGVVFESRFSLRSNLGFGRWFCIVAFGRLVEILLFVHDGHDGRNTVRLGGILIDSFHARLSSSGNSN